MSEINNEVRLIGRIGNVPAEEIQHLSKRDGSGTVAKLDLRLAVTKLKSKKTPKETNWFTVELWGNQAESVAKYKKKGEEVTVLGELDTDQWEKDGKKQTKYKVANAQVYFNSGGSQQPRQSKGQSTHDNDDESDFPPF